VKHVILTSYTVQIYTALIGVVMMPLYLHYLGTEAMGLVGFFAMLQTWLMLLDFGMTPTLSRQMATYKAGTLSRKALGDLLRTLEWLFGLMACLVALAGILSSSSLAVHWLRLDHLEAGEVTHCISMMAAIAGLRWVSGLYRSGLIGLEAQNICNGIIAVFTTLKFVGVVPWMIIVSPSPTTYFSYLLAISVAESVVYWYVLRCCLGAQPPGIRPSLAVLKDVLPFAGSLAFTTSVWLLIMNLDKLLLSHFLPLKEYGYFSIAIAVASGVLLLISPIAQVAQPRLTILYSQGKREQEIELFRECSQFTAGLMAAVCLNSAIFAEPLLYAWTGDADISAKASRILFWYALGNGAVGVLTLPYMIQHATGNLRLHVIGNIVFGCIQIPAIVYAAREYGALGTGVVWFFSNVIVLATWTPVVFRRYLKGMYLEWLVKDVLAPWGAASISVALFSAFCSFSTSRALVVGELMIIGVVSLLMAWLAGGMMRARLFGLLVGKGK
jgi:O-antigen/teichoic acid export membrane protein